MRIGVPVVLASLAIGCNAILDWGELHKTPTPAVDEEGTSSSSSSSSGKVGSSGGTSGTSGTSGTVTPACDVTKPFLAAVPVPGRVNTSAFETSPSLTADELTMFFQRTVGVDGGVILMSSRATRLEDWGDPIELPELQQNEVDYSPTVTGDGLTLYWVELTTASPRKQQIKTATRASKEAKFGNVQVVTAISNTSADDSVPYIAADGSELFFTSTRQGDAKHLFHSIRSGSAFGAPSILSELVSGDDTDANVTMSADGLTLFFGSERTGGLGQADIWTAKRSSKTSAFANIAHLDGPVNTTNFDWPTWLSPDGCRLYKGVLVGSTGEINVASRP